MRRLSKFILFLALFFLMIGNVSAVVDDAQDYLAFDNNLTDSSGNGNTATQSSPNYQSGKLSNAIQYNGVSDFTDTNYDLGSVYTITFWAYFTTFDVQDAPMGVRDSSGTAGTREFNMNHASSNTLTMQWYTSASSTAGTLSVSITENAWNYITLTRDGNNVEMFVNSNSQDTDATSGKDDPTQNLVLGRLGQQSAQYFDGLLDEVAIYDRVITQSEINTLYNSGTGFNPYVTLITPIIQNDVQDFYNTSNISIQLNTTSNVNMSYVLDDSDLIVSNGLVAYYQAENNANDRLGLNNGTWSGTEAYTSSVNYTYGNAFDFDGSSTIIVSDDTDIRFNSNGFSYFAFYKTPSVSTTSSLFRKSSSEYVLATVASKVFCSISSGTTAGVTILPNNQWIQIGCVYNGTHLNSYLNGVLEDSNIGTGVSSSGSLYLGSNSNSNQFVTGQIDEVRIYNRSLNTTEITQLYETSPYSAICEDCNNSLLSLSDLEEIEHSITFRSQNTNGIAETFANFTIDLTPPVITQIGNISEGSFAVNFSNIINVTELNPGTCFINITEQENVTNPDNFFINCTDTQTFTSAGLHNGFVTATDLAGNQDTYSFNFTIIPFVFVQFQYNATLVFNYSATIYHPDGRVTGADFINETTIFLSPVNDGELDLGVHTIQFSKEGFVTENFTLNITESSGDELSIFNVSVARITVNIFDRQTGNVLLSLVNINILNLGNTSTSNGTAIFQDFNFLPGEYHIEASSEGYYTSEQDFVYSGEENAIVNMYLLNATFIGSTTLVVPVIDEFFNVIQGADTRLLEYDTSIFGFKEVASCLTNSNGECKFLVEVSTKTYIVTTSKEIGGVIFQDQSSVNGEIFLPDISAGEEIPGQIFLNNLVLKLSSTLPTPGTIGFRIDAPENTNATIVSKNNTATVINIPVSFTSQSGLSYTVCLEIYRKAGDNFVEAISPVCLTAASGILPTADITLNNDFDYQARVTYEFDGHTTIYKTYLYPNNKSFVEMILESGFASPMIMFFWVILLSGTLYLRNLGLWCWGAWTLSVVQLVIFANLLVASSSVMIIVINVGVFYISKRQVDTV